MTDGLPLRARIALAVGLVLVVIGFVDALWPWFR